MKKLITPICLMMFALNSSALSLSEMKVEGLRSPLGVDVARPHFSWTLQSEERGCRQKSYRIAVTDASGATVWESGTVESTAQFGIVYEGQPLKSRSPYRWTVTVTDNKGGEAEGSAVFETAFLSADEWSGQWIHATSAVAYQTLDPLVITFDTPVTCRYIRLNVSELGLRANGDSGYSFVQLSEMEIYSGDNNLARSARFTVGKSADNWELASYGWSLSYINDGKTRGTLGWTTTQNPSTPVVLTADLKSEQTVDRIVIYPRQDDHASGKANNIAANFPASFTIQTSSDNRSYDVAYSQSAPPAESLPYFGKTFTIDSSKRVQRARMYASALGVFTMKLNGTAVTSAVLEPGESEYEKTLLYSTYDVTDLLRSGNNSLVAQVAGGIFDIDYLEGRFSKGEVRNSGQTGLIAELHIAYTDGSTESIVTDSSWRTTSSPTLGSNWWGGEDFDARLRIGQLDNLQLTIDNWNAVSILDKPAFSSPHSGVSGSGRLRSRMYEPLKVVEEWKAVGVKTIQSGGYTLRMIDFGRNFAGTYRFRLKGRAGQQISLRSGENINPDGSIMMENFYTGPSDTYDVYTFAGDADGEQWGPEFMYHGFRYLQIIGLDEEPSPEDFTAMRIRSDLDLIGSVETSNQLINDIHIICRDAIASQLYNSITDCPHREKLGWLDVPNEMYVSLNMNFGMENFYKKVVLDCFDAQQANGWVPSVCPFYMNVYGDDTNWGGAAILVPYRNWKYYGDKSLMETYYPKMKKLVQHFRNNTTGHLINNSYSVLSDWGQQTAGVNPLVPTEFTETTTYYYIIKAMAEIAAELGQTADATNYEKLAAAVKDAFNAKFYNPATGVYTSVAGGGGRQSEQAQPLYYGLVPEGDEAKVAAVLAEAVKRDGYKIKTGEIALKCVFMSLAKYGYNDIVWQMANQTDCPSYGYWVKEGYTTTPEYWNVGIESQNHCMMDHIEEWFFTCLAGIQNCGTAFDHILLKPYIPADLQQLSVKTACTYGQIAVEWEKKGEAIDYQFTVPAGTQATIVVAVPEGQLLMEGTQAVTAATDGVTQVTYADSQATVQVGSGTYRFTTGVPAAINTPQAHVKPLTTDAAPAYTLSGVKAAAPQHGIIIQRGSKQLVR